MFTRLKFLSRKSMAIWGVTTLLLAGLILLARNVTYERIHLSEKSAFDRSSIILQKEILSYMYGLQGMASIVQTHGFAPTSAKVREYAEFRNNFSNFGGALGFGFIRLVPRGELSSYLQNVRTQRPDFETKALSDNAGDHYIIEFVEPLEQNAKSLGLDVATEPFRREAAISSRLSRQPTLTGPLELLQIKTRGKGLLFFYPIFDRSTPDHRFIGWSFAPILIDDVLKTLQLNADERLVLSIHDVTDPNRSLEIYGPAKKLLSDVKLKYSSRVSIGGRIWELRGGVLDQGYHAEIDALSLFVFLALMVLLGRFIQFMENLIKKKETSTKKLVEVESWRNAVLDSTSYAIISTDTAGLIQTFNHAAEAMLGYKAAEVVRRLTPESFHVSAEVLKRAADLSLELGRTIEPGFSVFVEKAKMLGSTEINDWTYVKKDGSTVPVRLSVTAIRSEDQQVMGFMGIAEDISRLQELQSKVDLQQANLMSVAKMSALGEMAGGIAHEINNPLAILDGRINLIFQRIGTSKTDLGWLVQDLEKMQATIHRIAKIIIGLQTFSRDGRGDPRVPVRLGDIVHQTLDLCRERFASQSVQLTVSGDLDASIDCRASEISQVLLNLLNNSFDAIQGKDVKWITIAVEKDLTHTRLLVTDCGTGIDGKTLSKIMEPFFTTKEVGKGTGLGLSISTGIMSAHDGQLRYNKMSPHTQFIMEFQNA